MAQPVPAKDGDAGACARYGLRLATRSNSTSVASIGHVFQIDHVGDRRKGRGRGLRGFP